MRQSSSRFSLSRVIFLSLALVGVTAALSLGGCTTATSVRADHDYQTATKIAQQHADAGRTYVPDNGGSSFSVSNGFYVPSKPIAVMPLSEAHSLPAELDAKPASLKILTPTSLTAITAILTRETGVTVSIDQDVLSNDAGKLGQVIKSGGAGAGGGNNSGQQSPIIINKIIYSDGNLSGLLDNLTAKVNLYWRWNGTGIEIFRYETKTFNLDALAGVSKLSSKINTASSTLSQGGGGGTQASSNTNNTTGQTIDNTNTTDVWSDVTATIQGMLSPNGRVIVSPTSGTLTVRDTPPVLSQIALEIRRLNAIYSKQVALNIEVYSVDRSNESSSNINWNIAFANAAHHVGLNLNSAPTPAGWASGNAFSLGVNGGPFSGSKLILQALNQLGTTTLVTSGQAISLNGQSVPLNVSHEQAYLQSQTTTIGGGISGGLAATQLNPGLVTSGFSMNFTPLVTQNNDVLMRYSIDLSTINGIATYTAPDGSASIQLPQRTVRNFMQNVMVHSGETLVLTGFQQNNGSDNQQGMGKNGGFWLLGGGRDAKVESQTIVIVVTPYILGSN